MNSSFEKVGKDELAVELEMERSHSFILVRN